MPEGAARFTLLSYNLLAPSLLSANPHLYREAIAKGFGRWSWRRQQLLAELTHHRADVMCVQELDIDTIPEFMKRLEPLGYQVVYGKRDDKTKSDGCAVFYSTHRFDLIEQRILHYHVEQRANCAAIVVLRPKADPSSELLPQNLLVASTHLLYNPKRGDVKLIQLGTLLQTVEQIMSRHPKTAALIGGDFNSMPSSAVYRLATEGKLHTHELQHSNLLSGQPAERVSCCQMPWTPAGHGGSGTCAATKHQPENAPVRGAAAAEGVRQSRLLAASAEGLFEHQLGLKSAYADGELPDLCAHEPAFTTYIQQGTKGCVDYILYDQCSLTLVGRLEMSTPEELAQCGLPSPQWGSDHMSLVAQFQLCPTSQAPAPSPAEQTGTHHSVAWPRYGDRVVICGLQKRPQLNDVYGVVGDWDPDHERYNVETSHGLLAVRPVNLRKPKDNSTTEARVGKRLRNPQADQREQFSKARFGSS